MMNRFIFIPLLFIFAMSSSLVWSADGPSLDQRIGNTLSGDLTFRDEMGVKVKFNELLTYLWFAPDKIGEFELFCSEFCGTGHSKMMSKVEIVPENEFAAWLQQKETTELAQGSSPAQLGAELVRAKGCVACHSVDGTAATGPTFKGLWGKQETVLKGSQEAQVTVDEGFLRSKLFSPEKERVKGFPPIMPSQQGVLSEKEAAAIVEYLKTLR